MISCYKYRLVCTPCLYMTWKLFLWPWTWHNTMYTILLWISLVHGSHKCEMPLQDINSPACYTNPSLLNLFTLVENTWRRETWWRKTLWWIGHIDLLQFLKGPCGHMNKHGKERLTNYWFGNIQCNILVNAIYLYFPTSPWSVTQQHSTFTHRASTWTMLQNSAST